MEADRDHSRHAYAAVPYPGIAHPAKHPRALEAIATLFGMQPAALPRSRVLELGSAAGWNLIPQAVDYPGSRFLGVDRSAQQIGEGQEVIRWLGLRNIELRAASITDVDGSWGEFDYILCAGVYSWVPPAVQEKILAICAENLADRGVAMVSYNTFPGWHVRGIVRELTWLRARRCDAPQQQIAAARAALDFLAEHCSGASGYARLIREDVEFLRGVGDEYLFHDYVAEDNRPLHFREFVARAERAGLQYLGENHLAAMAPAMVPELARQTLQRLDLIEQGQYLDFLRNTAYRRSLLCRPEVSLVRKLEPAVLERFQLVLAEPPQPDDFEVHSDEQLRLRISSGELTIGSRLGKAALKHLIMMRPRPITLDALYLAATEQLGVRQTEAEQARERDLLAAALLECWAVGLVQAFVHPPQFCSVINERPVASTLARLQAGRGSYATNQLHENVSLSAEQQIILPYLDGAHDRGALAERLEQAAAAGSLEMSEPDDFPERLQRVLHELCQFSLLVG